MLVSSPSKEKVVAYETSSPGAVALARRARMYFPVERMFPEAYQSGVDIMVVHPTSVIPK